MYLDYLVPSWFEIESRIIDAMGYQGGAHFIDHLNQAAPDRKSVV